MSNEERKCIRAELRAMSDGALGEYIARTLGDAGRRATAILEEMAIRQTGPWTEEQAQTLVALARPTIRRLDEMEWTDGGWR
jgi:type II secretory pathway predicted ATPase ExeA